MPRMTKAKRRVDFFKTESVVVVKCAAEFNCKATGGKVNGAEDGYGRGTERFISSFQQPQVKFSVLRRQ